MSARSIIWFFGGGNADYQWEKKKIKAICSKVIESLALGDHFLTSRTEIADMRYIAWIQNRQLCLRCCYQNFLILLPAETRPNAETDVWTCDVHLMATFGLFLMHLFYMENLKVCLENVSDKSIMQEFGGYIFFFSFSLFWSVRSPPGVPSLPKCARFFVYENQNLGCAGWLSCEDEFSSVSTHAYIIEKRLRRHV